MDPTTDQTKVEELLVRLRESRLSSDERRATLETFRTFLEPLTAGVFQHASLNANVSLVKASIDQGPNDVRRIVLQTLSSRIEELDQLESVADDSVQSTISELVGAIEAFLRSALKIQSSKSMAVSSRPSIDVASLPTSALRATAAALKTLHALIRILPKQERSTLQGMANKAPPILSNLFDVLLPCLSAGVKVARQGNASIPRSSSSFQAGAFSWTEQPNASRAFSSRNDQSLAGSSKNAFASRPVINAESSQFEYSSAGETDRKSDKSESERSDFSNASAATSSSRSRNDESRQQEAMTKLIRQNSLHCLIELNRHEWRALISRWSDLLPDQPAPPVQPARNTDKPVMPRLSAASTSSAPFSLCTLITQDPSTSVRIAAIQTLESILSHGTLQLSMAQERAQRVLSFTSLSSQLAGWIVNVRSYLVVALRRATSAPRASANGEATGYPSSLTIALLSLSRTFVVSTAKAKLVASNATVLGPMVTLFASHSDPELQAAAKRVIAALSVTRNAGAAPSLCTRKSLTSSAVIPSIDKLQIEDVSATPYNADPSSSPSSRSSPMELTARLSQTSELTRELCDQALNLLGAADKSTQQLLPVWTVFVKSLADAQAPLLDVEACQRLSEIWQDLSSTELVSSDQKCTLLATIRDLYRALTRHSALNDNTSLSILEYIKVHRKDTDEAVRSAAVRALGLLVLPADSAAGEGEDQIAAEAHQRGISEVLQIVLWGDLDKARSGALHDKSNFVRQRASWAFSNAMEARLRSATFLDERDWLSHARYCLEAGKDIEGVAVSAYRASGSLVAMLAPTASSEACSAGKDMLEQLCRVLSTSSKPPKSRWNAASGLDRALGSDVVLSCILGASGGMTDRIVELLCSNLNAKVFKIRVSAANALLSLCLGTDKAEAQGSNTARLNLLGVQRSTRIQGFATARLAELAEPTQSKESALYIDELKRLLSRLAGSTCSSACS
ncbi:uncharacterized protein UTRI_02219 [Ustilago trichophora]|uniref:DUF4042 domain-containing protein n=1 Tax=Ustilago trichophora TaxID=86804 RepID=A0A5C3E0N9_9BASI|nr:uncharacterized protein UTRI_02219 [Ustilago trichophora]